MAFLYFWCFTASLKKISAINVTYRPYPNDIKNFNDLFAAMREVYDEENLTRAGFLIAKNSSSIYIDDQSSGSGRTTIDSIFLNPTKYAGLRFLTRANDPIMEITFDFLSSKVYLESYTITYSKIERYINHYQLFGEVSPGNWILIDDRTSKDSDIINLGQIGVEPKNWAVHYNLPLQKRNYSKFKMKNIDINKKQSDRYLVLSKLLFFGTLYPGKMLYTPEKALRKETMIFNFAMFSNF